MFEGVGSISAPLDDFGDDAGNFGPTLFSCMKKGFAQVAEFFLAEHRLRRLRGRPGIQPRHGQAGLAGTFAYEVGGNDLDSLGVSVFSTSKYARVQEFGATITPKNALYLRFKIGDAWISAKKVTIPPRLGFAQVWDDTEPQRKKILGNCVSESFERGGA